MKTEAGPDGFLWQLWEYDDHITLQRNCDAEGCDKGLLLSPARNCSACQGSGYRTRTFHLGKVTPLEAYLRRALLPGRCRCGEERFRVVGGAVCANGHESEVEELQRHGGQS